MAEIKKHLVIEINPKTIEFIEAKIEDVIEKMKCCGNCKHYTVDYDDNCEITNVSTIGSNCCEKWEIIE